MYREVFIKGHYRKNGVFVSPHLRKIKVGVNGNTNVGLKSYHSADKDQLAMDFSGITNNNLMLHTNKVIK
jgi:hypothetical protein|tara:strand:- start:97 stop:306 length:210 start_codon:yes stop_codon:yes gene_type:complete